MTLAVEEIADKDRVSADLVVRGHYVPDFSALTDTYGERDLEEAHLREMERFIRNRGPASPSSRGRSG